MNQFMVWYGLVSAILSAVQICSINYFVGLASLPEYYWGLSSGESRVMV